MKASVMFLACASAVVHKETNRGSWDDMYLGQAVMSQAESKAESSASNIQTEEQAQA